MLEWTVWLWSCGGWRVVPLKGSDERVGTGAYCVLVLGRSSVVACSMRRGLRWVSPGGSRGDPPLRPSGGGSVVACRRLLGGAFLPFTPAASPRTLTSGGAHGSLLFASHDPPCLNALHLCTPVVSILLFLVEAGFSRLITSLDGSRAAQPRNVSFIASSASQLNNSAFRLYGRRRP